MSWDFEVAELQRQIDVIRQRVTPGEVDLPRVPGVVEFVLSPEFLAKATLFPRQATILKVMFLDSDSLTAFDLDVLEEWQSGFVPGPYDDLFEGRWFEPAPNREFTEGTTPDVMSRIAQLRERGRHSFGHVNIPAGRRGARAI